MDVTDIMQMIDEAKVERLGNYYKVDKVNTKLTGHFILKLFVKSALKGYPLSLRGLEEHCNSNKDLSFLLRSKKEGKKRIDHSSLGKRLEKIEVQYFRSIYEDIVEKYHRTFSHGDKFHRFDSTMIAFSGKLLKGGLNCGGGGKERYIKVSVGMRNRIPSSLRFCTEQAEASDDIALVRAINEAKLGKEDILLFDRGVMKSDTLTKFTENQKLFITRVNLNRRYTLIEKQEQDVLTKTLQIYCEETIYLHNQFNKPIPYPLRLIKSRNSKGEELWFLTNILFLTGQEVTQSYKKRWEIEVLFRFLKQNLQFKRFVSYGNQGMSVYIYCLLIAAILFIAYKTANKLKGYKISLLKFAFDLDKALIKDIVSFCGGNPNLVDKKL